jgi:hypothetical protein
MHGDWKVLDTTLWPPVPLKKWNSNLYQSSSAFIIPHHHRDRGTHESPTAAVILFGENAKLPPIPTSISCTAAFATPATAPTTTNPLINERNIFLESNKLIASDVQLSWQVNNPS